MRQKQVLHSRHMQLFWGSRGLQPYRQSVLQIKHPFVLFSLMFVMFYPHYSAAIINFPEIWRKKPRHSRHHLGTFQLSNTANVTTVKTFPVGEMCRTLCSAHCRWLWRARLLLMFLFRKWKVKTMVTARNILPRWLLVRVTNCLTWTVCEEFMSSVSCGLNNLDACARIPWR